MKSRQRVQGQDHGAQPAVADRLFLSEDHWLGLVLSIDDPRRLLALHYQLEAVRPAHVVHKPHLLWDNGPSYVAGELADYLAGDLEAQVHASVEHY